MVRLVYRPYTQVWRTICTLVSLPPSTRVSPGFGVLRRSSPSFGSYQICSCSSLSSTNSGWPQLKDFNLWAAYTRFLYAMPGFSTLSLACLVHSLVRVSRRAGWRRRDVLSGRASLLERLWLSLGPGRGFSWPAAACATASPYSRVLSRKWILAPESALPFAFRKSVSRLLPDLQLAVMIRRPRRRPVKPARHSLRKQVTTLQPLPTQRFQVF